VHRERRGNEGMGAALVHQVADERSERPEAASRNTDPITATYKCQLT
jgi:hypothetical protein